MRRFTALWWISAVILVLGGFLMVPEAIAEGPLETIRSSTETVMKILKDPDLKGQQEIKDQRLWEVVSRRFDFEEMARRSLAVHWRNRTPQERSEFVELFSQLLYRAYVGKFEGYTDEQVEYIGEEIVDDKALVRTKILGKGMDISIDYRMVKKGPEWMIYDVVIEGVSLVNNYRNQFNRIVLSDGYPELVKRLRTKWEEVIKESGAKGKRT